MRYYITTFPGIEQITKDEIKHKWSFIEFNGVAKARNNSLLFFGFDGDIADLLSIRTAEDLYVQLASIKLSGSKQDLRDIKIATEGSSSLEPALALHRQLKKKRGGKRTTFRVVAQASGGHWAYRRVDAQKAVERAINDRYHKKWKLVEDNAQIEMWLHLIHNKAIVGLRMSDKTMRHRTYKVEHLPASLRPTIAFALVWLSGIEDDDVFLDPMCGAGTILIERANAGRYKELLGGDIRPEAVRVALRNIGDKYKPISVKVWDARKLPLHTASVNKLVTNLPFGRQIGSHEYNKSLYHDFSKELVRVLNQGGRAVLLTSEWRLLKDIILRNTDLKLCKHFKNIQVLGYSADIFMVQRL